MIGVTTRSRTGEAKSGQAALSAVGCLLLIAIVAAWTFRAFHDRGWNDFGLAYFAGKVAWMNGHPETVGSWIGTPLLAAVMALEGNVVGIVTGTDLMTALNMLIVVATIAVAMRRLRGLLPTAWWWVTAFALVSFAPMMSSVWYKQFNLVSFALALGGFELLRRQRPHAGGALIGLLVAFKPLFLLMPFVLLARRATRRAGVYSLAWLAGSSLISQGLLAWRGHSLRAMNLIAVYHNFSSKAQSHSLLCYPDNYTPSATLCRLGGAQYATAERFVALAAVALIALWTIDALRGRGALSWELFAFTCPLSIMVGPTAWSHYQIMLAPLFVLLVVRFTSEGARRSEWAGLAAAFLLVSLIWQPYGTSIQFVRQLVSSGTVTSNVWPTSGVNFADEITQFAPYILLMTGVLWYARNQSRRLPAAAED